MAFVAILDACVLHPAPLRDLLVRLARDGIISARWSERILDECFDSIVRTRPDLEPEQLRRTRRLMCAAVRDCLVRGFEELESALTLPDENDRHVAAAAIRAGAQAIVTFNLRDFPAESLAKLGVEAIHPDAFVAAAIDREPFTVWAIVEEQAAALRHPPVQFDELLEMLERIGLVESVARLRQLRA